MSDTPGGIKIKVSANLQQFKQELLDIAGIGKEAGEALGQQISNAAVSNLNILESLSQQLAKVKLASATKPEDAAALRLQVDLLKEKLRFEKQSAALDKAAGGLDESQYTAALRLIKQINKEQIDAANQRFAATSQSIADEQAAAQRLLAIRREIAKVEGQKSFQTQDLRSKESALDAVKQRGEGGAALVSAVDNVKASREQLLAVNERLSRLKELARYEQEISKIQSRQNKNLIDAESAENAKRIATELSKVNLQRITQETKAFKDELNKTPGILDEVANGLSSGFQGIFAGFGFAAGNAISQAVLAPLQLVQQEVQKATEEYVNFTREVQLAVAANEEAAQSASNFSDIIQASILKASESSGVLPTELAKVATEFSRAGIGADGLAENLTVIGQAGQATGESLSGIANTTIRTANAFGLSQNELARVTNTLVAAANASTTGVTELGDAFKYAAPAAAQAGQSVETVGVLFSALANAGQTGSVAGTGLTQFFERLKLGSLETSASLQQLNRGSARTITAFKTLGAQIRDSSGKMKDGLEVLSLLRQGLQNLDQSDKDAVLRALFGADGGRAALALLNTSQEKIDELTKTIKEGGLNAAASSSDKALTGLQGTLTKLGAATEEARIKALKPFESALDGLATTALKAVQFFSNNPLGQALGASVAVVTTAAVAWAGWKLAILATELAMKTSIGTTIAYNAALLTQNANIGKAIKSWAAFQAATAAGNFANITASLSKVVTGLATFELFSSKAGLGAKALQGLSASAGTAAASATTLSGGLKAAALGLGSLLVPLALAAAAFKVLELNWKLFQGQEGLENQVNAIDELNKSLDVAKSKISELNKEESKRNKNQQSDQYQVSSNLFDIEGNIEAVRKVNSVKKAVEQTEPIVKRLNELFAGLGDARQKASTGSLTSDNIKVLTDEQEALKKIQQKYKEAAAAADEKNNPIAKSVYKARAEEIKVALKLLDDIIKKNNDFNLRTGNSTLDAAAIQREYREVADSTRVALENIDTSTAETGAKLATAFRNGAIGVTEYKDELRKLDGSELEKQLQAYQNLDAAIQKLRAASKDGVLPVEVQRQYTQNLKDIARTQAKIADNQIAQADELSKKTLEGLKRGTAALTSELEKSGKLREAAIKKQAALNIATEEEANLKIIQDKQASIQKQIAIEEAGLAKLQASKGKIKKEDFDAEELSIRNRIADLAISAANAEIEALNAVKKARVDNIELQKRETDVRTQSKTALLQFRQDALSTEKSIREAVGRLQSLKIESQAQANDFVLKDLDKQAKAIEAAYQPAIEQLKNSTNMGDKERAQQLEVERQVKLAIIDSQRQDAEKKALELKAKALEVEQQTALATLQIERESARIASQRASVSAKAGVLQAQADVLKAQASGASPREISILQQVVALRRQESGIVEQQAVQQEQLFAKQEQVLLAQQKNQRDALQNEAKLAGQSLNIRSPQFEAIGGNTAQQKQDALEIQNLTQQSTQAQQTAAAATADYASAALEAKRAEAQLIASTAQVMVPAAKAYSEYMQSAAQAAIAAALAQKQYGAASAGTAALKVSDSRSAGADITARKLDGVIAKLSEVVAAIKSTPKTPGTLVVQSNNPVGDAARVLDAIAAATEAASV